jgi:hypothetical protein
MTDWAIRIPHRDRYEPLSAVAGNVRHLPAEDREVAREIILNARLEHGIETAGGLLDHLGALEPHERRQLLDQARAEQGLPSTGEIDAQRPAPLTLRNVAGGGFPSCAAEECNAAPMRLGIFYDPGVRKWWCPTHVDQAEPGDLEPRGSGLKLSPSGVPIDDNPGADAADRAREASRRAQLEAEAGIRAVEAAELRASNQARDEAHRRELPEHLRELA